MRTLNTRLALGAIALATLAWQGCSTDNVTTAPGSSDFQPLGRAHPTVKKQPSSMNEGWNVVASAKVNPGHEATLQGSRYTLTFSPGALSSATTISISERDSKVVDVKLSPDGTVFNAAVTLTVDYTGTPNDPGSPYFTGFAPKVRRFDPSSNSWSEVPGTDNPATKTYVAQLSGFSRYAMADGMQAAAAERGHTNDMQ